ncbi:MAG: AAA family ATPase [Armatimonadetes bacterium]|nr:AAA family ATPase [Armatimonadota bacterium]
MLLKKLTLKNFRCYDEFALPVDGRLSILIGENDCGKSVILDAIHALLSPQGCRDQDVRITPKQKRAEPSCITGEFVVESHDALPEEYRSGDNGNMFVIRRSFEKNAAKTFVVGYSYSDTRFDDSNFKGADIQKNLLKEYGLKPAGKELDRRAQRTELINQKKLTQTRAEIELPSWNAVMPYLPRTERIDSTEYRHPDAMIQRALQSVVSNVITPIDPKTGEPRELASLRTVRRKLKERLDQEISKAKTTLQVSHQRLRNLSIEPNIDFSRCLTTGNIAIDIGAGTHLIESYGEGTKKRIWMGLLEWERETSGNFAQSVVRLYDEPDVNLHYEAQRELFKTIFGLTANDELKMQCFVCTHSVFLIDRAPLNAINLIKMKDESRRSLTRVATPETGSIVGFLNDIGKSVGLTNTTLLYERAFLSVEGESEEASIPIIYTELYGTTMAEDGIVLINLHSCSAWKSILELLLRNRIAVTYMLLDNDCRDINSSARLTKQELSTIGCSADYLSNNVTFIGTKEYEDAFSDAAICTALNNHYPLENGDCWLPSDIATLRLKSTKFSDDLRNEIRSRCIIRQRNNTRKPEIARAIAASMGRADVPEDLRKALSKVRRLAGYP